MDGIANVARQQQTQTDTPKTDTPTQTTEIKKIDVLKKIQDDVNTPMITSITSKEEVEELVEELNDSMTQIGTRLQFGVDKDNIFYVSVIDLDTNEMIRRFPAEKAEMFLEKMQEVTGMLFDSRT